MQARKMTKADFDVIVNVIDRWWDGPLSTFAHPIFFYELGDQALVVDAEDGTMIGFLLGFVADPGVEAAAASGPISSPNPPASGPVRTGYVHLVGIHPDHRRRGVGRLLYRVFIDACRTAGCLRMKAITTLGNEGSLRFHLAQGWSAQEVDDYAGPNRRRVVFMRNLVEGEPT